MSVATLNPALSAALAEFGGFTYDPRTDSLVMVGSRDGYAIAIPGTERNLGTEFTPDAFTAALSDALASIGDHYGADVFVGGWRSDDRGYMIELTTVHNVDRSTAMLLGVVRDQDAIFDLGTGEEIDVRSNAFSLS